ncbi:hypothetical protein ACH5RR_016414 [Cinchona calisaya]|uniref:Uncharacterized protein n=1 Tax=Cinchona calisaya TaxID=153742 RepID=A0ABD2ZVT3_9GENT
MATTIFNEIPILPYHPTRSRHHSTTAHSLILSTKAATPLQYLFCSFLSISPVDETLMAKLLLLLKRGKKKKNNNSTFHFRTEKLRCLLVFRCCRSFLFLPFHHRGKEGGKA